MSGAGVPARQPAPQAVRLPAAHRSMPEAQHFSQIHITRQPDRQRPVRAAAPSGRHAISAGGNRQVFHHPHPWQADPPAHPFAPAGGQLRAGRANTARLDNGHWPAWTVSGDVSGVSTTAPSTLGFQQPFLPAYRRQQQAPSAQADQHAVHGSHLHRGTLGGAGMRQTDQCITSNSCGAADGVGRPWDGLEIGRLSANSITVSSKPEGRWPTAQSGAGSGIQATAEVRNGIGAALLQSPASCLPATAPAWTAISPSGAGNTATGAGGGAVTAGAGVSSCSAQSNRRRGQQQIQLQHVFRQRRASTQASASSNKGLAHDRRPGLCQRQHGGRFNAVGFQRRGRRPAPEGPRPRPARPHPAAWHPDPVSIHWLAWHRSGRPSPGRAGSSAISMASRSSSAAAGASNLVGHRHGIGAGHPHGFQIKAHLSQRFGRPPAPGASTASTSSDGSAGRRWEFRHQQRIPDQVPACRQRLQQVRPAAWRRGKPASCAPIGLDGFNHFFQPAALPGFHPASSHPIQRVSASSDTRLGAAGSGSFGRVFHPAAPLEHRPSASHPGPAISASSDATGSAAVRQLRRVFHQRRRRASPISIAWIQRQHVRFLAARQPGG